MTSLDAYIKFVEKVNRNNTGAGVQVPRGKFVLLFNEAQRSWLKETLKETLSSADLDKLEDVLVDDRPLEHVARHRDHEEYRLPEDFYRFVSCYCLASKGECTGRVLVAWPTKSRDLAVLLRDANQSPSFEYEETLSSIASGKVRVYFSDFGIDAAYLSYYRFPASIDLEGYILLDGTASKNQDPELGDDMVEEILNLCASEFMRNQKDTEGLQIARERQQSQP